MSQRESERIKLVSKKLKTKSGLFLKLVMVVYHSSDAVSLLHLHSNLILITRDEHSVIQKYLR